MLYDGIFNEMIWLMDVIWWDFFDDMINDVIWLMDDMINGCYMMGFFLRWYDECYDGIFNGWLINGCYMMGFFDEMRWYD